MSYQNVRKMIHNQTRSIRYDNIEAICLLLDCTPNDLFLLKTVAPSIMDGAPKHILLKLHTAAAYPVRAVVFFNNFWL